MANEVNNISRSFADNVNYIAELDKQYYKNGYIKKNGIQLGSVEHYGNVTMNVFNKTLKVHSKLNIISGSIVGNNGLSTFLNNMKIAIQALYPDVAISISITDGTNAIVDKNLNITLSSTDTMLGLITIDISTYVQPGVVSEYKKYSIVSSSDNFIAVLPYLSTLDDSFTNSVNTLSLIEPYIKNVNNNMTSLTGIVTNVIPNITAILNAPTYASTATIKAAEALASSTSASTSASTATTKATEASSSAASALASKNAASTSETNALASKNAASTSETNALAYKNAAATSATNASTSETNALASKNAAATSATSASGSATTATTKASEASTSATNAATSATASASSATASATSATNAAASATSAANSATAASTSATSASTSASTATTKAAEAVTSATNAASSATSASNSATSASGRATTATTKAGEASTSASNAAASATASANSATNSATSATASATSATNSANSATAAAASAASAAAIAGGSISLDSLNNVTVPTPTDGDILSYVTATTDWRPLSILPVSKGGTGVTGSTGTGNNVLSNSPTLVTPVLGVATGTSFNGITGLSSATPLDNGTAAVGTATTAARADHVHSSGPVVTSGGYIPAVSISGGGTLSGNSTKFMYTRIGNIVTVSGRISITFGSIGTEAVGTITVPITMSTAGASDTAHGVITKNKDGSGIIFGRSLSTSEVSFSIIPNNLNQSSCRFIFTYQLSAI